MRQSLLMRYGCALVFGALGCSISVLSLYYIRHETLVILIRSLGAMLVISSALVSSISAFITQNKDILQDIDTAVSYAQFTRLSKMHKRIIYLWASIYAISTVSVILAVISYDICKEIIHAAAFLVACSYYFVVSLFLQINELSNFKAILEENVIQEDRKRKLRESASK